MAKIKVADLHRLSGMYQREEISFGRMVEMLNEIAEKAYSFQDVELQQHTQYMNVKTPIKLTEALSTPMEKLIYHSARMEAMIEVQERLMTQPTKTFEAAIVRIHTMIQMEHLQSLKALDKAQKEAGL